jgi:GTP-binding protein Era
LHKAGFVNIIGNPNVGKSTLMNALVGEKLSIITSKSQTTRHRIMGICNGEDFQIVYSDTPGIVNPHYRLHKDMMSFVSSALTDADLFLLVTDIGESLKSNEVLEKISTSGVPIILLINKIDLSTQDIIDEKINYWRTALPKAFVLPCSAKDGIGLDVLLTKIKESLPENPPYFPKDELTDKPMRFFVSEIIREKILTLYNKEIPYSCQVEIAEYKETDTIDRIIAYIYVERESQKGIVIGKNGSMLKKVGTLARKDIEDFTGKHVFLETHVKVLRDWRNNDSSLRRFGYETK